MNWLDRTIAAVAPRVAVKRAAARRALSVIERAPNKKRRLSPAPEQDPDWGINTGRVRGAMPVGRYDRMRIRHLIATNPYAAKMMQSLLNNLVGFGITGTPVKATPKKVTAAWNAWVDAVNFYGQQELMVQAMLGDGEVYIVRRFVKGAVVPLRLQLLDAGMLASGVGENGTGIDYDAEGNPVKYHFRPQRVGMGGYVQSTKTVSFDAKDVIHLYRKEWIGQLHGRSVFEPVVKALDDLVDYFDAELVRKKIEACFAAFITPSGEYALETNVAGSATDEQSTAGFDIEAFEPGMIERLAPGDDVKFGEPKPSADVSVFSRAVLLGAAAGVGVPYEHGTGDLSNVNYSSYKAGALEFRRFCGRLQWLTIIPDALSRIWQWFLEDGWQTGQFARADYGIAWTPAEFEPLDLKKEVEGQAAAVAAGFTNRREIIAARGYNYDQQMEDRARDDEYEASLGLKFDTLKGGARAPDSFSEKKE